MQLFYSNTSPYSRKVRLVVRQKGLSAQVEEVLVNPFGKDTQEKQHLLTANPLGKIPTLLLDDGTGLYDSPVICQYLDDLSDNNQLIPINNKLNILRWEAMADGLTDATYNIAVERKRPDNEQSCQWIENWSVEIRRTLLHIEQNLNEIDPSNSQLTLAHFALASAISYLELRFPEGLYQQATTQTAIAPKTLEWFEEFKKYPAMKDTQFID